jgi:hypothetical protein
MLCPRVGKQFIFFIFDTVLVVMASHLLLFFNIGWSKEEVTILFSS